MTREEARKHLAGWLDEKMWRCFGTIDREAISIAVEALSEPQGDYISRADAIRAVAEHFSFDDGCSNIYKDIDYYKGIAEHILKNVPSALPSAEAEPTVIRSRTLMPTKDFKEWAKRVREENPNVIIIPCDAEVVSAEAESDDLIIKGAKGIKDGLYNIKDGKLFKYKANGGTVRTYPIVPSAEAEWIPCSERLPKKGEVVLITNGKGNVRCGQYRSEYDVRDGAHYWWWKGKTVETVLAWMPLPKPYREDGEA